MLPKYCVTISLCGSIHPMAKKQSRAVRPTRRQFQKKEAIIILLRRPFAALLVAALTFATTPAFAADADTAYVDTAAADTGIVTADATAPQSAVVNAATDHHIDSFALAGGILNREGVLYMPLNETLNVMGAAVTANPDNQANKLRLDLPDGTAAQLTLTDVNGVRTIAGVGASSAVINENGADYVSMAFIQALTNRVVSVYDHYMLLITVDQNPIWKTLDAYTVDAVTPAQTVTATIATAESLQGVPYVWGGTTPAGFDCSGFVQYCYAMNGVNLPRTSYAQQAATTPVSLDQLQTGDLVFWGAPAYHVGIYIGDGLYIHSPAPGQSVKIQSLSSYTPTSGGRIG